MMSFGAFRFCGVRSRSGFRSKTSLDFSGSAMRDTRHAAKSARSRRLAEIDARIAEMISLRDHLAEILRDWDVRLAGGEPAHLLEAL
jgi:hypothetical protein